jgi:hypothetical protein
MDQMAKPCGTCERDENTCKTSVDIRRWVRLETEGLGWIHLVQVRNSEVINPSVP